jgi:hypothetical protein
MLPEKRNHVSCATSSHQQRRNQSPPDSALSEQCHLFVTTCCTGEAAVVPIPALHADMCTSNQMHLTDNTLHRHTMLHSAVTDEASLSLSQGKTGFAKR